MVSFLANPKFLESNGVEPSGSIEDTDAPARHSRSRPTLRHSRESGNPSGFLPSPMPFPDRLFSLDSAFLYSGTSYPTNWRTVMQGALGWVGRMENGWIPAFAGMTEGVDVCGNDRG